MYEAAIDVALAQLRGGPLDGCRFYLTSPARNLYVGRDENGDVTLSRSRGVDGGMYVATDDYETPDSWERIVILQWSTADDDGSAADAA